MEVGKGQQGGARKAAVYPHHCGQNKRLSGKRLWAFIQTTADKKGYVVRQANKHSLA